MSTALSGRDRKILFAAVTEYIATGDPVGSRTLARKYALDLSPATIRNVLSDLEAAGYLSQPHTSAGRVPTEDALRRFIEALTDFHEVPPVQLQEMCTRFDEIFAKRAEGADSLRSAGKVLSEMAGAAAVVATSPAPRRKLSQLRFIVTKPKQMLAVLVFSDGLVENRYIMLESPISESELQPIHNLLSDVVEGRTLDALRELFASRLAGDRLEIDRLREQAFDLGSRALGDSSRPDAVVIEGSARLMELPEYGDVDRLKKLMVALEARENLVQLLHKTIDSGAVSVYIGSETGEFGDAQLSLVLAPYGDGEQDRGTVGVLGPTRMDYAKILPLVDATADAITAAIKKRK